MLEPFRTLTVQNFLFKSFLYFRTKAMRIILFVMVGIVFASGFGGGIAFIITRTVKNRADEPVEVTKEKV